MRLNVIRIELQHALELGNCFVALAMLGQHPAQIISRADEIRIQPDRRIEFFRCLVSLSRAIENDAKHVVRHRRSWPGSYSSARLRFGFSERV